LITTKYTYAKDPFVIVIVIVNMTLYIVSSEAIYF